MRFKISFVAVPAFMRVDPASTSGPTRGGDDDVGDRAIPGHGSAGDENRRGAARFAKSSAALTNGVTLEAEMPDHEILRRQGGGIADTAEPPRHGPPRLR